MGSQSQDIVVNVPPEKFYQVIRDYEHYNQFVSSVQKVEIVKQSGDTCEVYFELNLIKTVKYFLEMVGEPTKKVSWSLIKGDLFKVNSGSWELQPAKGGKATKATYTTEVEFSVFIPKMITNKLTAVSLPTTLREFKERAESI